MKRVFEEWIAAQRRGEDAALVTVIAHAGSTPRGAGSQMLVLARGRVCGTIGGGFAEREAEMLAMQMLAEKRSCVRTYVLHPVGMGAADAVCGGEITVHVQYIAGADPLWAELSERLVQRMNDGAPGWFLLREDASAPALLGESGQLICGSAPDNADAFCKSGCVRRDGVFSMPLLIGERVAIFGAGHCAQALVPVLASVGFRVIVMDPRPQLASEQRFPQAERVICGDFSRIAELIALTEEDYVVVMTSGHEHDLIVQEQILRAPLAYIGVIGSRRKKAYVEGKLREAGIDEARLSNVHTPIGLDIMAVTPEEIAVSIAGEMILCRARRRQKAGAFVKSCPMH